ncbi:MAG TPA: biotin-independent malonate decarboxylase subunit gamma [Steroidobacteraceae bacterium]|jgi:malonate decarboxylase gamma subunit|nr:biotin-independent malonate decarboxylase subunit gamma [Steroidobacteraceae bacterium]
MTLDEALKALFGSNFTVDARPDGTLLGEARLTPTQTATLIGVVDGAALGIEGALILAHRVLSMMRAGQRQPILLLIDSSSQRMSHRDELFGLNEYLAHLAKVLWQADRAGFPTVTLLYGGGAAGAFVTTALATRALVALPGAHPAVMDLASIARVTKLPPDMLQKMSESTAVFAPGIANIVLMGAVTESWTANQNLSARLVQLLAHYDELPVDGRDQRGQERGGRTLAVDIAGQVMRAAIASTPAT